MLAVGACAATNLCGRLPREPEMKLRGKKRGQPEKHSLRVQGWIYAVLNSLVDGIIREGKFLETGNLTWRFFTQDFEFLLPAAGYVGPGAEHTFEDFFRANPKERPSIERHDRFLENLRKRARGAYETLVSNESFVTLAEKRLADYELANRSHGFPGGATLREDFPRLVAERVVNNIQEIPHYFTDAVFWGRYGEDFARFRVGIGFRELDSAREVLRRYDSSVIKRLKDLKFGLCETYDLPADPLPYMSYVAERPSYP